MSNSTKILLGLCLAVFVAGCNRQPEPEPYVAAPAPVVAEPTFSGKYN